MGIIFHKLYNNKPAIGTMHNFINTGHSHMNSEMVVDTFELSSTTNLGSIKLPRKTISKFMGFIDDAWIAVKKTILKTRTRTNIKELTYITDDLLAERSIIINRGKKGSAVIEVPAGKTKEVFSRVLNEDIAFVREGAKADGKVIAMNPTKAKVYAETQAFQNKINDKEAILNKAKKVLANCEDELNEFKKQFTSEIDTLKKMTDSKLIKLAGELKAKKDVLTARANGSKAKKKINIKEYQARIEFLEKEIKEMGFDPKDIINAKTVEKNYQLHIKKVNEASMMATDAAKNLELAKTAKIKPTKASIARKNTDGSTTYVLQKNTKGIIEEDDIVVLPKKLNDELESIINKYSKLFSDESLDHVKHRLLERFAQGIKKTELIGDEAKSVKTITSLKGIEAELIKIKKMLTSGEDFSSKYLSGEMKPQGQVGLYWAHGNSNNNRLTYMIPNGDTFDGIVLTKEGKIITVMNDITPAQFREHFVPLKAM